jgi:hypothetical protein
MNLSVSGPRTLINGNPGASAQVFPRHRTYLRGPRVDTVITEGFLCKSDATKGYGGFLFAGSKSEGSD